MLICIVSALQYWAVIGCYMQYQGGSTICYYPVNRQYVIYYLHSVYRKPMHTDLYLQWDNHHNLSCKYSVINPLTHRAKAVCSSSKQLEGELNHLQEVLTQCKHPKWATDKVLQKQVDRRKQNRRNQGKSNTKQTRRKCHRVLPYLQGLCESYKTICSKYGVQVHFNRRNTLKNLLMLPKGRETLIILTKKQEATWLRAQLKEYVFSVL